MTCGRPLGAFISMGRVGCEFWDVLRSALFWVALSGLKNNRGVSTQGVALGWNWGAPLGLTCGVAHGTCGRPIGCAFADGG